MQDTKHRLEPPCLALKAPGKQAVCGKMGSAVTHDFTGHLLAVSRRRVGGGEGVAVRVDVQHHALEQYL